MGSFASLKRITPTMLDEHWGTVTGSEHELGVMSRSGEATFDESKLPPGEFTESGARIYKDMGHPEMCTPEATNPLQLVALERALMQRMHALKLGKLFKNCVDYRGSTEENHTFGAHENYFTSAPRSSLDALIPFFVSRTIIAGSGDLSHGEKVLHLSQRAPFIVQLHGWDTLSNRALINDRDEPLSNVPGWYRLHLIQGDANMSQVATLLKHGTTMLVLRLLEDDVLVPLPYKDEVAIDDLHAINRKLSGWEMRGVKPKPLGAVAVQAHYLEQVRRHFSRPTPLQGVLIDLWAETLQALDNDPTQTVGITDWATKQFLLELLAETSGADWGLSDAQSVELEYHAVNPKRSLYVGMEREGMVTSVVSDSSISHFQHHPPETSRAYGRGHLLRIINSRAAGEISVGGSAEWDEVTVYRNGRLFHTVTLPDPRKPYVEKVKALANKL